MSERKTDIVYFLGAGFSAPYGIPTMKDMVDGFEKEIEFKHLDELRRLHAYKMDELSTRELEDKRFKEHMEDPLANKNTTYFWGGKYSNLNLTLYDRYKTEREEIERLDREISRIESKYDIKEVHKTWRILNAKVEGEVLTGNLDIETILSRTSVENYLSCRRGLKRIIELYLSGVEEYEIENEYTLKANLSSMLEPVESFDFLKAKGRLTSEMINNTITRYLNKYRGLIVSYIRDVCSFCLDGNKIVRELDSLTVPLGSFNIDLFTTNYDLVIENLLDGLDIPFELGIELDHRVGITYWDFNRIAESNNRIRLIKLHGSIDLYNTSDGRIIKLPIPTAGGNLVDGREIHEMLIYPTQQKSVNDPPYCDMFKALVEAISQTKVLVFIGFNFNYNDKHISEAVEKGIANNRQLKKVVVVKGHPEDSVKELLKIKGLGRKRIKAIAGRMPKREVASEIVTTIREVLG